MSVVFFIDPNDCDPPHGLDLNSAHDQDKIEALVKAFKGGGFSLQAAALVGYPLNGRIQLLSGTHRHIAAKITNTRLPITLWLRGDIEKSWGELQEWSKIMEDIPVATLLKWTREDMDNACSNKKIIVTQNVDE